MGPLRRIALVAACAALAVGGCGGDGKLKAVGRVVKGGVPFSVPEDEYVRVTFHPIPADGRRATNTYVAEFNNGDGTFTVVGADGKGLPPGKYRVSLEHERNRKDLFRGAYDADRSPFVFDVSAGSKVILIDLDKKSEVPR